MADILLSDDVINTKELRDNLKFWLDKAEISPVSVRSGNKRLVLLNRQVARGMYLLNHYAPMVIRFCQEMAFSVNKSTIFPWIEHLNEEEIVEFRDELLVKLNSAACEDKWADFEEMLEDWKATAEVNSNPEVAEALLAEEDPSTYVRSKD